MSLWRELTYHSAAQWDKNREIRVQLTCKERRERERERKMISKEQNTI